MKERSTNAGPTRIKVEALLEQSAESMSNRQIADATGCGLESVKNATMALISSGQIQNVSEVPGRAVYLHRKFIQRPKVERDHIGTGTMPNGDLAFWKKHMAWQNTPARVELLA